MKNNTKHTAKKATAKPSGKKKRFAKALKSEDKLTSFNKNIKDVEFLFTQFSI